jgi:hypothetical protein
VETFTGPLPPVRAHQPPRIELRHDVAAD